jgi:hypothetical protein
MAVDVPSGKRYRPVGITAPADKRRCYQDFQDSRQTLLLVEVHRLPGYI